MSATTSARIGCFGGALSSMRADDLGAIAPMARHSEVDRAVVEDAVFGCANPAGKDNRNVARMATLLAGLPVGVTGTTIHRRCGSGMGAVLAAALTFAAGEVELMVAGGMESMTRTPFVMLSFPGRARAKTPLSARAVSIRRFRRPMAPIPCCRSGRTWPTGIAGQGGWCARSCQ